MEGGDQIRKCIELERPDEVVGKVRSQIVYKNFKHNYIHTHIRTNIRTRTQTHTHTLYGRWDEIGVASRNIFVPPSVPFFSPPFMHAFFCWSSFFSRCKNAQTLGFALSKIFGAKQIISHREMSRVMDTSGLVAFVK